jgi:hypothetical protein
MVVEALLVTIFLPGERANTYSHKGDTVATFSPLAAHSTGPA